MLLALEESAARTRSATHPARRSSAHPPDVPRQPDLGRPAHPRRAAETRYRDRRSHGRALHGASSAPVPTENLVPPLCTLGIIEDLASACSHHGPCGPSVSYCSPRWAQACRARRRSRLRTRRFVINERSCSDRPAGARGCGPLTGCSGRGSVTCGPDGGERSSSSSPTPFSGGIDEGCGAIGAGRVGRADPVGHASRAPFKCSSARCATPTRPGAPRASTASC